jgi:hypothetical protein
VRTPEEALAAARQRAAKDRLEGRALVEPFSELTEPSSAGDLQLLAKLAIIEPDVAEIYSTRRLGRPITLLKRLLIRLLRQYFVQLSAQQARFNAHAAAALIDLDKRIQALEQRDR